MDKKNRVNVIGGGLAGCEAAYQLAKRGFDVTLFEMRGTKSTPCHHTNNLAELVCSNSLKSTATDTASGMLKLELSNFDSLILRAGEYAKVPAGAALAVDREKFSGFIENQLKSFENLRIQIQEITVLNLDIPTIVATGPLTSDTLAKEIGKLFGQEYLHFFDAVAPIITAESIDFDKAFFGARYDKGDKDYLNCPMTKPQYLEFYNQLRSAKVAQLKEYENNIFQACMPIEVMASKGEDTMRFGPLRPTGLRNPIDDSKPYAVVQLRKENNLATIYNLVGFQTNLTFSEQKRVFALIPGLENLEIVRYGVMHRNTFINSPKVLNFDWSTKQNPYLFFAGQMTGVEGYVESAMSGCMAGINMARKLQEKESLLLPENTIIGQLQRHISTLNHDFQPMNANFGILPPITEKIRDKKLRKLQYTIRGQDDLKNFLDIIN